MSELPGLLTRLLAAMLFSVPGVLFAAGYSEDTALRVTSGYQIASKNLLVYRDTTRKLSIYDIMGREEVLGFTRVVDSNPGYGFTTDVFWACLDLENPADSETRVYIEVDYPNGDYVDLYYLRNNRMETQYSGDNRPVSIRQVIFRNPVFMLNLAAKSRARVYLRFQSDDPMIFPVNISDPVSFMHKLTNEYIVLGMFTGTILVMLFYNLFIYFSVKDKKYLYYIIFIFFAFFFHMVSSGLAYQYFWPDGGSWSNKSGAVFACLALLTAFVFTRKFLNLKAYNLALDKTLRILIGAGFLGVLFSLLVSFRYSVLYYALLGIAGTSAMFLSGVIVYMKGYRPARYYVIAWSLLLIGVVLFALRSFDLLPVNFLTNWAIQLGAVFEVVMLSLALADHINVIKKEKEKAQREAIENLHRADKVKDEFLANTSHELRTPLNGIIGLAESLVHVPESEASESVKNNLMLISSSGRRLASLINDILDFSRLKKEEMRLQVNPVDIEEMVQIVVANIKPLIGSKPISISVVIPRNFPTVHADPARLQQVLFNLIGNAVKFTESGTITISVVQKSGRAWISVRDTGRGIPEEKIDEIFGSFCQLDGVEGRKYPGTGLGLAITRELVRLHGGSVTVQSEEGFGSVFTFDLEISGEKARPVAFSQYPTADTEFSLKDKGDYLPLQSDIEIFSDKFVLIVDDEFVNRKVLVNVLSLLGAKFTEAQNGADALEQMGRLKPDLVLLDVMLPDMDGFSVCREIRKKYSISDLPVMMITAKSQLADIISGLDAGANDFISKPFAQQELIYRMKAIFQVQKAWLLSKKLEKARFDNYAARKLQKDSLPTRAPEFPGFRIVPVYEPAEEVGGDLYEYSVHGRKFGVFIGDVAGHGVSAAMFSGLVKIAFGMISGKPYSAADTLTALNQVLTHYFKKYFCTVAYTVFDTENLKFSFVRAGHPSLIVFNRKSGTFREVSVGGIPVGIVEDYKYLETSGHIEAGDRFVMLTDGLIEAIQDEKESFSLNALLPLLRETSSMDTQMAAEHIKNRALQGSKGVPSNDDITLILVDCNLGA